MLRTKYIIGCFAIASIFASCEKEDSYDIKGDPTVKFFIDNNPGFGNAPDNSISYTAVNIPDAGSNGLLSLSSTIPATIKFPVYATQPISNDVAVTAELDTTLISVYNSAHNTTYAAFPAGVLNTTGLVAHINKGTSTSVDSISIATDTTRLNLLTQKTYMAPIKLTSMSLTGVGEISTTTKVTYIVVNVEQRRIKYLATTADIQGALLTPRTAWITAFNPAVTTVGNIIDGSLTTFSRWVASPGLLDVDMQVSKNITGIRLYTSTSATYVPTKIDVYLSNDGINYDLIGSPLKANLTYASSYNYILFYKAITARYIRLNLSYPTSTNTQNYRVVEFDAYAN